MSRIADALGKAVGAPGAADELEDHHPWGGGPFEDEPPVDLGEEPPWAEPVRMPRRPHLAGEAGVVTPFEPTAPGRPPGSFRPAPIDPALDRHFEALVQRVFQPVSGDPPRSVGFCAVGPGVSSAAITAAVAQTLARRTGASVCVVDANFAAPALHRHFNIAPGDGFAEALAGTAPLVAAAQQVDAHLWLLPAGRAPVTDSLASDAVRGRLAHFMAEFEYVLVDVEPVADAAGMSGVVPLLAGVILVLGAETTRREAARRVAQTLTSWGTTPLGAVLTDRRFPIPETLYRHL